MRSVKFPFSLRFLSLWFCKHYLIWELKYAPFWIDPSTFITIIIIIFIIIHKIKILVINSEKRPIRCLVKRLKTWSKQVIALGFERKQDWQMTWDWLLWLESLDSLSNKHKTKSMRIILYRIVRNILCKLWGGEGLLKRLLLRTHWELRYDFASVIAIVKMIKYKSQRAPTMKIAEHKATHE